MASLLQLRAAIYSRAQQIKRGHSKTNRWDYRDDLWGAPGRPQFAPVSASAADQATSNSRPDMRNRAFAASYHWALFFFLSFGLAVISRISHWRVRSSPDASGHAFASMANHCSKRVVSMSSVLPRWHSSPRLACSGMTPPRKICSQNGSKCQSFWVRRNRLPVSGARSHRRNGTRLERLVNFANREILLPPVTRCFLGWASKARTVCRSGWEVHWLCWRFALHRVELRRLLGDASENLFSRSLGERPKHKLRLVAVPQAA